MLYKVFNLRTGEEIKVSTRVNIFTVKVADFEFSMSTEMRCLIHTYFDDYISLDTSLAIDEYIKSNRKKYENSINRKQNEQKTDSIQFTLF